jgi:hypothetical protein
LQGNSHITSLPSIFVIQIVHFSSNLISVVNVFNLSKSSSCKVHTTLLLGATIVTAAGLLKLNIEGPGLTESFKSVWRKNIKKNE